MFNVTDPADVVVRLADDCALTFRPGSPAALIGGRRAYRQAMEAALARDPDDMESAADAAYEALALHLAKTGLKAWTGIGDKTGQALPPSPKAFLGLLASHPVLFGPIDAEYVAPFLLLDAEKNASTASATGTSRSAAGPTAKGARTATPKTSTRAAKAMRKAQPARTGSAAPTAAAARTAKTTSKPTPARSRGRS
jgi:hypothetical protein